MHRSRRLIPGQTREEARAGLRPVNFQGRPPRGRRSNEAARTGKAGNGDPLAVSDLFELLPAFLSHHPDQEDPKPTLVERPWNRPY